MEVTAVTCRMCPCSFRWETMVLVSGICQKRESVGKVWGTRYSKLGKRVLGWV